jgi:hypothetical protein
MHCYSMLAETGRIMGFLAAIQLVSMWPIRETKSQPHPMCGLDLASAYHGALARFTLKCAGLAHCQVAPGRAHLLRGACARRDIW